MDSNTQRLVRQVYLLINSNASLLNELQSLATSLSSDVEKITSYEDLNLEFVTDAEQRSEIITKKIEDNNATLNNIVSSITVDDDYFANASNQLFKRAKYIGDTIPATAIASSLISSAVTFENNSCFTDWTKLENIMLKITISNAEIPYSNTLTFNLNNEDIIKFNESKTFNVSFTAPSTRDTYNIRLEISDGVWDFEDSTIKKIAIV